MIGTPAGNGPAIGSDWASAAFPSGVKMSRPMRPVLVTTASMPALRRKSRRSRVMGVS